MGGKRGEMGRPDWRGGRIGRLGQTWLVRRSRWRIALAFGGGFGAGRGSCGRSSCQKSKVKSSQSQLMKMNSLVLIRAWAKSVQGRGSVSWFGESMLSWVACWLRKLRTAVVSSDVGGRAKAVVYIVVMRCSGDASLMARALVAQWAACCWMKGSFIRIKGWAGTLEMLRRPMVVKSRVVSKARSMGGRKWGRGGGCVSPLR